MALVIEDQRLSGRGVREFADTALEQLVDIQYRHRTRQPSLRPKHRARRDDDGIGPLGQDGVDVGLDADTDLGPGRLGLLAQPVDIALPARATGPEPGQTSPTAKHRPPLEQHDLMTSQRRRARCLQAGHPSPDDHDTSRLHGRHDLGE